MAYDHISSDPIDEDDGTPDPLDMEESPGETPHDGPPY